MSAPDCADIVQSFYEKTAHVLYGFTYRRQPRNQRSSSISSAGKYFQTDPLSHPHQSQMMR